MIGQRPVRAMGRSRLGSGSPPRRRAGGAVATTWSPAAEHAAAAGGCWLPQAAGAGPAACGDRCLVPGGRAKQYWVQARLAGFALDRVAASVVIGRDGSTTIRRRFLVLLLHETHWELHGSIETPVELTRDPRVRIIGVYRAPVPDRLEMLAPDLDGVFAGRRPGPASRLVEVSLADCRHEVSVWRAEGGLDSPAGAHWVLDGERPEPDGDGEDGAEPAMTVLVYEAEARYGSVGQRDAQERFSESVVVPCRLLTMEVASRSASATAVTVREVTAIATQSKAPLVEDGRFLTRQALTNGGVAKIAHPVTGVTYTLRWSSARGWLGVAAGALQRPRLAAGRLGIGRLMPLAVVAVVLSVCARAGVAAPLSRTLPFALLCVANATWPVWVNNLANLVQIASPLFAFFAWWWFRKR